MKLRRYIVRNSNGPEFLELFMISAVASILAIRAFLKATGYPQVGGDGLHIAHMLWGGLFMAMALFLVLGLLGPTMLRLASILGGIGFGTFIDELGKFITSDNNYFYEPTLGIIYIIFISIFLSFRALTMRQTLTLEESLANVLHRLEGSVGGRVDAKSKREMLELLNRVDSRHPWAGGLKAYVTSIETGTLTEFSFYFSIKSRLLSYYWRLVGARWFTKILLGFFALEAIGQVAVIISFFVGRYVIESAGGGFSFVAAAQFASSSVAAAMIGIGLWRWRQSRLIAYSWFVRAILVNLFITQIFVFFESQMAGITGVFFNILIYLALRYLAGAEATPLTPEVLGPRQETKPMAVTVD